MSKPSNHRFIDHGPREAIAPKVCRPRRHALRILAGLCLGGIGTFTGSHALAAGFPDRPVQLIVPWPGGSDATLRALAEKASQFLGQPIVVVNKPGVSGTLGPAVMAKTAKNDGYTISQIPVSVFRMPHLQATNYDPTTDFTYIIGLSGYRSGVLVRADAPWKTWQEFIAYAKANPGKVTYATPGVNTTNDITMKLIARHDGIRWSDVPFKGTGDATAALMGGHVTALVGSALGQLVDSGKFRLLVTWGEKRTERWPDIPTLKELGYGLVATSPYGIAGPKGMDDKIVKVLHDAFRRALEDPAIRKLLAQNEEDAFYLGTDAYRNYAHAAYREQKEIVETLHLKQP
ncbi:tripartite tricarboxylate transporter substrate binding protein [Cupriavidus sp. DF5525]|uniref:tripartite tricarboxylate transporter substrate binding protein n=1 Tax=Cupriavidus sp. DF5525 TaxID=3160989 RepID=UPI0032DFA416